MNKPTKELFDEFFEKALKNEKNHIRSQLERPEIYTLEKELDKQFIKFNADEILLLLSRFLESDPSLSVTTIRIIASLYRSMFNYYIDHYEIIRNPMYDSRLSGHALDKFTVSNKKRVTHAVLNELISAIQRSFEKRRADYTECIIWLFYCGFRTAEEIVTVTEDMIDFKKKQVQLWGRTVKLSDRCCELLVTVHNMEALPALSGGDSVMVSYRGSYFKFPTVPSAVDTFDQKSVFEVSQMILRKIALDLKRQLNRAKIEVQTIKMDELYFLGFYDYMVATIGKEKTQGIIWGERTAPMRERKERTRLLEQLAISYGLVYKNIARVKQALLIFE